MDLVLNALKKEIGNIGRFDITSEGKFYCGTAGNSVLKVVPKTASVTFKTVTTDTRYGSAGGTIPVSWILLTPSVSANQSKAYTQAVTFDMDIDAGDLSDARRELVELSDEDKEKVARVEKLESINLSGLRGVVESTLRGILDSDHSLKPCIKPKTLKVQADFQVRETVTGDLQLNFIVAKVGGGVTKIEDGTQSVVITMDFAGSSPMNVHIEK